MANKGRKKNPPVETNSMRRQLIGWGVTLAAAGVGPVVTALTRPSTITVVVATTSAAVGLNALTSSAKAIDADDTFCRPASLFQIPGVRSETDSLTGP